MTFAELDGLMAAGSLTLRQVAAILDLSMAETYERLYGQPMPAPATPPATGRQQISHRPRRRPA